MCDVRFGMGDTQIPNPNIEILNNVKIQMLNVQNPCY
jgi:hypothetical protein